MNKKLHVFLIFFVDNIGTPEDYIGGLYVVAENIDAALAMAKTYGAVKSIHGQDYYIVFEAKPA